MKTNKKRKQKEEEIHNNPFIFSFQRISQVGLPASHWIEKAVSKLKNNKFQKAKFRYQAYYFGGDNLKVYPLVSFRDETDIDYYISPFANRHFLWTEERVCSLREMPKSLAGKGLKNSWDIFYGNMTFDKFIDSLSGEYIVRDFDEEEVKSALGDQTYPPGYITKNDKTLLELIRDNSSVLLYPQVTERLMYILNMARWAPSTERKNKAKFALVDYLIPGHKSNTKRLLPEVNYKLALNLAKKLAKHLSDICNAELKGEGYDVQKIKKHGLEIECKDDKVIDPLDPYSDLIEFAKKEREYRITWLKKNQLEELIKSHSKFTENFFRTHLSAGPKTLSTK